VTSVSKVAKFERGGAGSNFFGKVREVSFSVTVLEEEDVGGEATEYLSRGLSLHCDVKILREKRDKKQCDRGARCSSEK